MGGVSHVGKLNPECKPMAFTHHFLFLVNLGLILYVPSEYNVCATFNVTNLSLFYVGDDLRTNHFQGEENDGGMTREWSADPLEISLGPNFYFPCGQILFCSSYFLGLFIGLLSLNSLDYDLKLSVKFLFGS